MWNEPNQQRKEKLLFHFCAVGTRCYFCVGSAQWLPCATWWAHLSCARRCFCVSERLRPSGSRGWQ